MTFPAAATLVFFVLASLTLNVTPGPDMLFVIAAAGRGGPRAGVRAALGIGLGCLVHTLAAAAGLSALVLSSSFAFRAVTYLGAAYLVVTGARALFAPSKGAKGEAQGSPRVASARGDQGAPEREGGGGSDGARLAAGEGARRGDTASDAGGVFRRAVLTNVANPKVALFFLAFVPQFVDARAGHVGAQFLFFGAMFCVSGTLVNALVGALAGAARGLVGPGSRARGALDRVCGAVFVALGVRLAFLARP